MDAKDSLLALAVQELRAGLGLDQRVLRDHVTVSDAYPEHEPPFGAGGSSMPVRILAVQIRAFGAPTFPARLYGFAARCGPARWCATI